MLGRRIYYFIKPIMPRAFQIALRRYLIRKKLRANENIWPIDEGAKRMPESWPGWPNEQKFALVLTHDVESKKGVNKCLKLAEIEERLGFRSSFNFVAEQYVIPNDLLTDLKKRGFEVGIHGLRHDGNLFGSRKIFSEKAKLINQYLKKWEVVGFRAPSMYHDLEMLSELNIEYDSSTFDTDPFEPQPDGVKTIFPFGVKGKGRRGFVELPNTMPQDFTLFVLMKEHNIEIWEKKLRWIVANMGMALIITHPDYMNYDKVLCGNDEYPAKYYIDFLKQIKHNYCGDYWNALPREVAQYSANIFGKSMDILRSNV